MSIAMKHEAISVEHRDREPLATLVAKARVDYAADLGVDHAVVSEWLKTWGQADCRPFEDWLAAWDG